jgi:hypothetical protein
MLCRIACYVLRLFLASSTLVWAKARALLQRNFAGEAEQGGTGPTSPDKALTRHASFGARVYHVGVGLASREGAKCSLIIRVLMLTSGSLH